nr:abc transporter a family member 7 [Quercus suber]
MEEAEFLCERLGFFVNGSFQCIANPKEAAKGLSFLRIRSAQAQVKFLTQKKKKREERLTNFFSLLGL